MSMTWTRATKYSERADGTNYRVSASKVGDGWKFTLWRGPLLSEQGTEDSRMPDRLGIFDTAQQAKDAAESDFSAR